MEPMAPLIRAAFENPALRPSVLAAVRTATQKMAGSESFPVLGKLATVVTPRMIQSAVLRAGYLPGFFDFSKIQFDTVDPAEGIRVPPPYDKGLEATWRVFEPGKFGDRKSDYVWGTVRVLLGSSERGMAVSASIYVKT